ncbi:MAG: ABC transporter ATP-binding protein [Deltaproteobacteria bacterium]|nr:ABC transporter ATP-binding protein [Deltaproteobacteria bacterium]
MNNTLEVKDLKTHFFTRSGVVKAVDGVSFHVAEGETLGIVGESGSGKSITCLSLLRLVPPPAGRIVSGEVILNGEDLLSKSIKEMRKIRGAEISMILQDPMTSLNPVFTIGNQLSEPIMIHQGLDKKSAWEKAKEMLTRVKIPLPEIRVGEYPHQMSGGMRQRIVGAMALSCQPKLLIADEPTTALDVTIQAQFLQLLQSIQKEFRLALIVVTHDFGIVAKICDRVAVMYAGKMVETAPIREIFNNPRHPYTRALMNSLPKMDKNLKRLHSIKGQPPDLGNLPPGCSFAPRCTEALKICLEEIPPESIPAEGHSLSCWLAVQR